MKQFASLKQYDKSEVIFQQYLPKIAEEENVVDELMILFETYEYDLESIFSSESFDPIVSNLDEAIMIFTSKIIKEKYTLKLHETIDTIKDKFRNVRVVKTVYPKYYKSRKRELRERYKTIEGKLKLLGAKSKV